MQIREFVDRPWLYGNSRADWLVALGVAAAALGVALVARAVVARWIGAHPRPANRGFGALVGTLVARTRAYFLVALAVQLGAQWLALPDRVDTRLTRAVILAALIQVGAWGTGGIWFWVARFTADRRAASDGASITAITALGYLARVALWFVIGILILENFQIRITTLVAGLGITGVAVALALQNILGDLFGALSILLDKPFVVGDAIAVDGIQGTVERIGLKTTRLRALSGEELIVSNADLLKSRVRNYRRQYERRVELRLGVTLGTPRDALLEIPTMLTELITSHKDLRFDRAHLSAITDSAIQFELVYWVTTADYAVHMDRQQAVLLAALRQLDARGVRLASPARAVAIGGTLALTGDAPGPARVSDGTSPVAHRPGETTSRG
ncbi:MAG: mechanosensitive ion channel family protein [Gemmatimonadaceae bacterium]